MFAAFSLILFVLSMSFDWAVPKQTGNPASEPELWERQIVLIKHDVMWLSSLAVHYVTANAHSNTNYTGEEFTDYFLVFQNSYTSPHKRWLSYWRRWQQLSGTSETKVCLLFLIFFLRLNLMLTCSVFTLCGTSGQKSCVIWIYLFVFSSVIWIFCKQGLYCHWS